jgi:peptidoglycan/xylan/chitin deacetylase (PgdA/CDA1 family)
MAGLKSANPDLRKGLISKAESLANGSVDQELYRPMTRQHITRLHRKAHEIASHTVSHPILTQLDNDQLRVELKDSSEKLREWTGNAIKGFCYPNGDFDSRVERIAKEAGYRYACTMQTGLNHPGNNTMQLARLSITIQRTVVAGCKNDSIGFRSELCRLREFWR